MAGEHANDSLIKRLDIENLASAAALFTPGVVWHFFNPLLPDIQGDYVGLAGVRTFFDRFRALTEDTFRVEPISTTAVGDELVVTHTKNEMTVQGKPVSTDVVAVWRIVDARIAEVRNIPSGHTPVRQRQV